MPAGRPSDYSEEIADRICEEIMQGKSLRAICKMEGMPGLSKICRWLSSNTDFQKHYARAREIQAELLADEIVEIADDSSQDVIYTENGAYENREFISRSKTRIDARKWVATKLLPKKYGDKVQQEISITKVGLDAIDEQYD